MIDVIVVLQWVFCLCDIVDFFKFGILFKDIMLLFVYSEDFRGVIMVMVDCWCDQKLDVVVGIELCGFIFGVVMVLELGVGFVLVCKLGKLFGQVLCEEYMFEYCSDCIEVYVDVLLVGVCVVIIDDVLVIGGMLVVVLLLVCCLGVEVVGVGVLVEFDGFGGWVCWEVGLLLYIELVF